MFASSFTPREAKNDAAASASSGVETEKIRSVIFIVVVGSVVSSSRFDPCTVAEMSSIDKNYFRGMIAG